MDRKIPDREGYVVYVEARRIYIETVLYDFVKPVVQKVTMPGIIRAPITADYMVVVNMNTRQTKLKMTFFLIANFRLS